MNKYRAIVSFDGCVSIDIDDASNSEEAVNKAYSLVNDAFESKANEYGCYEENAELSVFEECIGNISVDYGVRVERIVDEELLRQIEEKERELAELKAMTE